MHGAKAGQLKLADVSSTEQETRAAVFLILLYVEQPAFEIDESNSVA